jgi:hypothetical protein
LHILFIKSIIPGCSTSTCLKTNKKGDGLYGTIMVVECLRPFCFYGTINDVLYFIYFFFFRARSLSNNVKNNLFILLTTLKLLSNLDKLN